MIVRLILSLLLAAFTFPAMAAGSCHEVPTAMADQHHSMPTMPEHQDKAVTAHSCIGCIPPSTMQPVAVTGAALKPAVRRFVAVARFDRMGIAPPATPPPRIAS